MISKRFLLILAAFLAVLSVILAWYRIARTPAYFDFAREHTLAEVQSGDLTLVDFGEPEFIPALRNGWDRSEGLTQNESYVWAMNNQAQLRMVIREIPEDPFLIMRLVPLAAQNMTIRMNEGFETTLAVQPDRVIYSIPLPANALHQGKNQMVFSFDGAAQQPGDRESRKLNCAVDYILIGSKGALEHRMRSLPQNSRLQDHFFHAERRSVWFRKKRVLFMDLPNTQLRYHIRIPAEAELRYGITVEGRGGNDSQEVDHTVRVEDESGQVIESGQRTPVRHSDLPLTRYFSINLASMSGRVSRIEFALKQPSGSGLSVGWIEPKLTGKAPRPPSGGRSSIPHLMEEVRRGNQNKNVVFFVLDASNARHYSAYGYNRNTTPNIDQLASQGLIFNNAVCQSVYTLASTADLFTGSGSLIHGVSTQDSALPEAFLTLPEILKKKGYTTAAFIGNVNASGIFGYRQGFDEMVDLFRHREAGGGIAEDFVKPVSGWLSRNGKTPFFLYVHFKEPHVPYTPPEPFRSMFDPDYRGELSGTLAEVERISQMEGADPRDLRHLVALYDGNLAYVDSVVGRILEEFKQKNLYENTVFAVFSDHGEALWEHGYHGHNSVLYEEAVHIPLILKFPGSDAIVNRKIDSIVRTIDITPTVLDMVGAVPPGNVSFEGSSMLPLLFGLNQSEDVFAITHTTGQEDFSLHSSRLKYFWNSRKPEELYDLSVDPGETTDLAQTNSIRAGYFRTELKKWIRRQNSVRDRLGIAPAKPGKMDEDALENLRALGYVN